MSMFNAKIRSRGSNPNQLSRMGIVDVSKENENSSSFKPKKY
jgi:hypothetical protein